MPSHSLLHQMMPAASKTCGQSTWLQLAHIYMHTGSGRLLLFLHGSSLHAADPLLHPGWSAPLMLEAEHSGNPLSQLLLFSAGTPANTVIIEVRLVLVQRGGNLVHLWLAARVASGQSACCQWLWMLLFKTAL